jgi:hypothetical protein
VSFTIAPAALEDEPLIIAFRIEASRWLAQLGTDQWANPFPPEGIDLRAAIRAGETWIAWDRSTPAATITVTTWGEPELWTSEELSEPAIYAHKLTVARAYAGNELGAEMMDWVGGRGYDQHRLWVRLDAWDSNRGLHDYYRQHGFEFVRVASRPPSGTLFKRPTAPYTGTRLREGSRPPAHTTTLPEAPLGP